MIVVLVVLSSLDNVIDVHMTNMRRKIRESARTDPIETVRGVGYRLKTRLNNQ